MRFQNGNILNKLGQYLAERRIPKRRFAAKIGRSAPTVTRYCLPFGHPARRIPDEEAMVSIYLETDRVLTPNDFYDLPDLSTYSQGEAA